MGPCVKEGVVSQSQTHTQKLFVFESGYARLKRGRPRDEKDIPCYIHCMYSSYTFRTKSWCACMLNEVRMHGASVSGVPIRGVHNLT